MTAVRPTPPATLVIFGVTGDLTKRLLMPALVNMTAQELAGDDLSVLGIANNEGDDESLRAILQDFREHRDASDHPTSDKSWARLKSHIGYLRGGFDEPDTYARLAERLNRSGDTNVVFYLATAPSFFGSIVERLAAVGLLDERNGFRRVAIEKPFGHDLVAAQKLNARILACAQESQFFRIDHFLGKDTVRNILMTRFANTMVEATWNNHYIDHVQITAAEKVDVGTRGRFYDATGALRDMVPNHLFQMLTMVAMEAPSSLDAEAVRDEKAKLLRTIRLPDPEKDGVRGVYQSGIVEGRRVAAYVDSPDVASDTRTETFAAIKLGIDSWRWAGVPFYLRTGKAMSHRDTEVVITFRAVPFAFFRDTPVERLPANRFILQIEPDESIFLDMLVKRPGRIVDPAPVVMTFRYADRFKLGHGTGYETLIHDLLIGDRTLFQRADSIEASWRVVQPFIDHWARNGRPEAYTAGSAGPAGADDLLARDGRAWHELGAGRQ